VYPELVIGDAKGTIDGLRLRSWPPCCTTKFWRARRNSNSDPLIRRLHLNSC